KLLVARSCDPPAEECPVRPSGINVTRDPANRTGVNDHRSTGMLATVSTAARNAVHRHAPAVSTTSAADHSVAGLTRSVTGCPDTSEIVSGTSNAAHTVHTPAAIVPVRKARYPDTSSTPLSWGGTRNAANMNDPTATTAETS